MKNPTYQKIRDIAKANGVEIRRTFSDKRANHQRVKFAVWHGHKSASKVIDAVRDELKLEIEWWDNINPAYSGFILRVSK